MTMRRPLTGFLLLFALAAVTPRASAAGVPDSTASALDAARAAARDHRWLAAETHARAALLGLPVLDPSAAVLDGAIDVFVEARIGAGSTLADSLAALAALDTLAKSVYEKGLFLAARHMLERSLAQRERTLDTLDFIGARAAHLLSNIVFDLGDFERSRDLYLKSKTVYERIEGPYGKHVSMMRFNLSNISLVLGDLPEARRRLLEVLEYSEQQNDRSGIGDVYLNLGAVLSGLHDPLGARRALTRCIEVRRSIGQSAEWIGMPFMNLADTYVATGEGARALALLDSAAFYMTGKIRDDHPGWAMIAQMRCDGLRQLGRFDEAETQARRTLELREKIFGSDHPDVADAHLKLADVLRDQKRWAEALRSTERGAEIDRHLLPAEHPKLAEDQLQLARAEIGLGDSARALALALDAEQRFREHLRLTAAGLGEAEALRQDHDRDCARDIALEVVSGRPAPQDVGRVYEAVVRARASVLDLQILRLHSIGEGPEVVSLRSDFERACTRVANLVVRGPGPDGSEAHRAKLDTAYAERNRAELALAARSTAYQLDGRARAAGVAEVRAALPADAAIVSFVRYAGSVAPPSQEAGAEWRYGAFVARGGGAVAYLPLGDAVKVDRLVALTRSTIEEPPSERSVLDYRRAAFALRKQVWDPLAAALHGARTVFVVPDGSLQLVSFAALPVSGGRYLVEAGPALVILSTERDLVARPSAGESGRGLLVVGGVDFDHSVPLDSGAPDPARAELVASNRPLYRGSHSGCADFSSLRLAALPATAREACAVSALWRSHRLEETAPDTLVRTLTGARASEDRFKRLAPGARVLHLATHGFFVRAECGPRKDFTDRADRYAGSYENALLRSGLALAGFNARETAPPESEDGVLTAEEVAALDLSGVRCVVLSACESGVGDLVLGEGVFGLRRAFMLAGAPTVVTSLSPVRDVPARAWTQAFYQAFARGVPAARAASRASRAMLKRARMSGLGTHPSEWGAFIAIGGWQ